MEDLDLKTVGKRFKEIYGADGVASDGRRYGDIPDEEVASLYIRKNGVDKAFATLGLGDPDAAKEAKKQGASLRKEFSRESKALGFKEVQSAYNKVSEATETGAGDLTIVYSYIKSL